MSAINRAVEILGAQNALADAVGVSKAFVNQWIKGERPVPPERCRAIEAATDGKVTRYDLRPDIFGAAPPASNSDQQEAA